MSPDLRRCRLHLQTLPTSTYLLYAVAHPAGASGRSSRPFPRPCRAVPAPRCKGVVRGPGPPDASGRIGRITEAAPP